MAAATRISGAPRELALRQGHHVADRTQAPQIVLVHSLPRQLLQLHRQIHRVDAVEIEVLDEARLEPDVARVELLEQLDHDRAQPLQDLVALEQGTSLKRRGAARRTPPSSS